MPITKPARFVALSLLLLPILAQAELPGLKVLVHGAQPASGTLEVSLFNTAESFMKQPYLQESYPVSEEGVIEAGFTNLPEGEYAIVVVHDANDNGALDRGFLGFGGESYGFSNNVTHWFGWPDFDDAKFTADSTETTVEISLN